MAFELVPGTRALALPWLWIVTGEPWSRCALALGTGDHAGLAALALDGGAGRGFVAASLGTDLSYTSPAIRTPSTSFFSMIRRICSSMYL